MRPVTSWSLLSRITLTMYENISELDAAATEESARRDESHTEDVEVPSDLSNAS